MVVFFVLNKKIFKYLKGKNLVFEKKNHLLNFLRMVNFRLMCIMVIGVVMDNLNEKNQLEEIFKKKLWKIKVI